MYRTQEYKKKIKEISTKTKLTRNCFFAFVTGGGICFFSELLRTFYLNFFDEKSSFLFITLTLIFLGVSLSALGLYDRLAHVGGAGTLVPVCGFANAVASVALDSRSEGYILGVGAKIFTVAGPVILYSTVAGMIYGIIYYTVSLF
jgi:stage V sporulation protein AC